MSKEYQAFKKLYVQMQMVKHAGNIAWSTFDKAYELLGGADCVYDVYCAFQWVSPEAQLRICGFTMNDVRAAMN